MPTKPCQLNDLSANDTPISPSFSEEGCRRRLPRRRGISLSFCLSIFSFAFLFGGCSDAPASKPATQTEAKPAEPAIPEDVQQAANTLLGSETQVLAFGDLAKTGKQELLAANVLPKTPTSTVAGTVVSRFTVAEKKDDGKWLELLHGDEHLKNNKGYLALTPLESISSWKLQFEQDSTKGLVLYLTPVKANSMHSLPIGIRWNPATKRYQSLDQSYQNFLLEAPSLDSPRSVLR
jgi:hypothetical protein